MRIATWNVNSLKARLDKLAWWIERARPDVMLLQETKLADEAAPREDFARLGYELAHCGQGRWNGAEKLVPQPVGGCDGNKKCESRHESEQQDAIQ